MRGLLLMIGLLQLVQAIQLPTYPTALWRTFWRPWRSGFVVQVRAGWCAGVYGRGAGVRWHAAIIL